MIHARTVLFLLLALILASRLTAAERTGAPALDGDAGHYHDIATNLSQGNGFAFSAEMQFPWARDAEGSPRPTARRPPLFPILLAGFYRLGLPPQAMLFFNAFLAALTGWVLWRLALAVGLGIRGALFTVGLYLVYPPFVTHSVRLLTETPYMLLLTGSMLALILGLRTRSLPRFALAGLLLGLATLVRPTSLFLPLALIPLVVWPMGRQPRGWLVLVAIFALTQAPWIARNAATFGKFEPTFTSRGYNLFMGTYPPTRGLSNLPPERQPPELIASLEGRNEFEVNRLYQRAALRNLREQPVEVAKLVVAKAVLCWFNTRPERNMFLPTPRSFVVNGPLLILGIVGFVMLLRERRAPAWVPVLVIVYFVAMHLASVATVRYNLPSVPFLLLGVAATMDRVVTRFRGESREDPGVAA